MQRNTARLRRSSSVPAGGLVIALPRPMAALFPRWANTAARVSLIGACALGAGSIAGLMIYVRTPYNTRQLEPVSQPVEFDHRHHVVDDQIDCLYCHNEAETSPYAGLPPTELCMGCHAQVWNESELLEPVRRSYFSGLPIPWRRVHRLADFVFFDHSVHVTYGIGCVRCHGRVDRMARVYQVAPLTMGWCLDCHRNPPRPESEPSVAPEHRTMWGATIEQLDPAPLGEREVTHLTTCTACHR